MEYFFFCDSLELGLVFCRPWDPFPSCAVLLLLALVSYLLGHLFACVSHFSIGWGTSQPSLPLLHVPTDGRVKGFIFRLTLASRRFLCTSTSHGMSFARVAIVWFLHLVLHVWSWCGPLVSHLPPCSGWILRGPSVFSVHGPWEGGPKAWRGRRRISTSIFVASLDVAWLQAKQDTSSPCS